MKVVKTKKLDEAINSVGAVGDAIEKIEKTGLDARVDISLGTADYISNHTARQELISTTMKSREELAKGLEGERESKEVKSAALKKMHLSESLFEAVEEKSEEKVVKEEPTVEPVEGKEDSIVTNRFEIVFRPEKKRTIKDADDMFEEILAYLSPNQIVYTTKEGGRTRMPGLYQDRQIGTMYKDNDDSVVGIRLYKRGQKLLDDDEEVSGNGFEEAKFIVDHYKPYGVTAEETTYKGDNVFDIWIPTDAPKKKLYFDMFKIKSEDKQELEEDIKVTREIAVAEFDGWSGAEDTLKKIIDAGKEEEFERLINEQYPDGIDETELNDLLRFEDEWLLDALGITEESEDTD